MKKYLILLFFICHDVSIAQIQLGTNINGTTPDSWFGQSISMSEDGTILAIGAPYNDNMNGNNAGQARIYRYISGAWTQIGNEINGEGSDHRCGISVSLSGNGEIVAIGSHLAGGTGKVRVFSNNNGNWTQLGADLTGAGGGNFGQYISISNDGTKLAIAAQGYNGNGLNSGVVRVYSFDMNIWSQIGSDLLGDASNDFAGYGVALSGDGTTLAIGSRLSDANGTDSGKTKIYSYASGNWTQKGDTINGETANDQSGAGVSLSFDGNILAIGAIGNDTAGLDSGNVRIFNFVAGTWVQLGSNINGEVNSNFGHNISLSSDGSKIIIGAYNYNGGNGHARIFNYDSNNWVQLGIDITAETQYDNCGFDVSMSHDGTKIAVGARFNDAGGLNSGNVRVFDIFSLLSTNSFSLDGDIKVYPNPVKDQLYISLKKGLILLEINIFSALGQIVKKEKTTTIDVSNLSKGIYFAQITTNKGTETSKIIVE